jgi:hypothetical protein
MALTQITVSILTIRLTNQLSIIRNYCSLFIDFDGDLEYKQSSRTLRLELAKLALCDRLIICVATLPLFSKIILASTKIALLAAIPVEAWVALRIKFNI